MLIPPTYAAVELDEVDEIEASRPLLPVRGDARSPLGLYLQEIRAYPRLTVEAQAELARRHLEGDEEAGRTLARCNLHLVVKVALQYHARRASTLDLIQEGNLGLLRAVEKFDPSRGVPFPAYARYWIRAMILRYLMENDRLIRAVRGRDSRKLFYNLGKARRLLERDGQPASTSALAEMLGVEEDEILRAERAMGSPISLEAERPDGRSLSDIVEDPSVADPERVVARRQLASVARDCMATFAETLEDERERVIWSERLVALEPRSLSDLGRQYDVSKERIRQVEVRLKRRLKAMLADELGPSVDFEFVTVTD